jgi:phenylpyruvate tautomerase PptA (4-oxalocrotonate tautomerase family)
MTLFDATPSANRSCPRATAFGLRVQLSSNARRHVPIVDIEVVCQSEESRRLPLVGGLASALGRVFGSEPGRTLVRLRVLDASHYAENDSTLAASEFPVFVTVSQAISLPAATLQAEVAAVTQAVAAWVARDPARVHVSYAATGAGRQTFGGHLV